MNKVNLFNLGAVEKMPAASVKEKAANKKEFDKVFQDLKKQEVASKRNQKNRPVAQEVKLGHLVNHQAKAKVIQGEAKNKANINTKKNVNEDFVTKISELAGFLNQIQQNLQILNQGFSNNEQGRETEQTIVNDIVTLLDGLKDLSQDLPLIQDLLGNFAKLDLNSLMAQMVSVDGTLESLENTELNLTAIMESGLEEGNGKVNSQGVFKDAVDAIPQELLEQLKALGTENSQKDISEAISKLTRNFANLQQTAKDLIKSSQENPILQEVLTKLNATALELQPAINLISKFPTMLSSLQNSELNLKDFEAEENPAESLQVGIDGFAEGPKEASKTTAHQDETKLKFELETASKTVAHEKTLKAGNEVELENPNENDLANLGYSPLVQDKQTNNLQQIHKLTTQMQASAARLGENVVDQLVQKATLMVKENFSEMRIQLTPQNLGKVDLQISIERGIVVAKFAAESQQVKELIEANLTNLKQQLTNQGLKVDQLTVNVGQQGFEQSNGYANQQTNFKPSAKRFKFEDGEEYQGVLAEEVQEVTRRYYSDNEVDYTA